MKTLRTAGPARRLLYAVLCAATVLLSAPPATPQGRAALEREMGERNADMMRELEMRRREGAVKDATPRPPPHPVLPYERGKEDFRTLQLVNNEMMRAVFAPRAAGSPDYERIAASAAEIGKRASRLKSNLRLPEQERKSPRPQAVDISRDEQLRASLRTLDGLIMGFVTNPVFRNSGTVDARHSAAAAENLTNIVELSRSVRLGAEKVRKAREAEPARRKG